MSLDYSHYNNILKIISLVILIVMSVFAVISVVTDIGKKLLVLFLFYAVNPLLLG